MPSQPIPMDPKYIIDLVVKRRWIVILPFCLSILSGMFLAVVSPRVYEAETMILVEPQRVPSDYVKSIVSTDISSRVSTISQQIMSRTNLEKIIEDFNLFTDEKWHNAYLEDKLLNLRARITVNVINKKYGADAFNIGFTGTNPEKVARVANALATYFIDENLKVREVQALGTSTFLDAELESMRSRLEVKEENLREYKKEYMGGLPEQLQTNLRILESLQNQKNEKQTIVRGIENSINTLKSTISLMGNLSNDMPVNDFELNLDEDVGGGESFELSEMKEELAQLKMKYTVKHPDVLQLTRMISELEAKNNSETDSGPATNEFSQELEIEPVMPAVDMQDAQLSELKLSLKRHKTEMADINSQISIYKKRIENTPQREQELLSIRRDYENLQSSYESLLKRKLEAEIAVNMERNQKEEQFKILDSARTPEKPIKPNLQKLYLLFIGLGLAIGGGLVFLIEFFDRSFKRPEDIETELTLPVLCTIPQILSPQKKKIMRVERIAFVTFLTFAIALFAVYTVLTQKGVEKTLALLNTIVNV